MVFKELEIQGFKSFPDKVKITFDAGVTGVVGPNGSGKSNLSDAVRWVLGETSSRQLRAAGKMEDVIFGGTRRRSAMGFASVRLTLDNTGHTLDVDADEVTIGRKYYRSGDSEYTINGQVCRLKDVYELLLDTGIGRDGYSVIGQGRIAEIVAAKSSERREIFEEACGIAKYRYRKTEAERRLAAAGENLERLRDILGELESRVGPLEKESAKAQKFLELSEQRKTLEVTLWTDSVHRARDTVRQQVRDYETAQADYERFDGEAKAAEQEAEEIRMQAQQLTIAVERLNGDIRSITEQISGSESRIAVLENDILRNEESAASLRQEIAAGEQDSTEAAAALSKARQELTALLAASGRPADALEPKFTCKLCQDTGSVQGRTCTCVHKLMQGLRREEIEALSSLSISSFDTMELRYYPNTMDAQNGVNVRAYMGRLLDGLKQYAEDFSPTENESLMLIGNAGLGKTHAALAIAGLVLEQGHDVIYVSSPDFFGKIEASRFDPSGDADTLLRTASTADLLILDDLGTEFVTPYFITVFYSLLNNRLGAGLPTIITTNITDGALLEKRYTEKISSRLSAFIPFRFLGEDIRPQKAAE